jgi:hypothetical protein
LQHFSRVLRGIFTAASAAFLCVLCGSSFDPASIIVALEFFPKIGAEEQHSLPMLPAHRKALWASDGHDSHLAVYWCV